jgi:hypothetical protein
MHGVQQKPQFSLENNFLSKNNIDHLIKMSKHDIQETQAYNMSIHRALDQGNDGDWSPCVPSLLLLCTGTLHLTSPPKPTGDGVESEPS